MAKIKTVMIVDSDSKDGYKIINESDYDSDNDKIYKPPNRKLKTND
jgi:hypothetical protein